MKKLIWILLLALLPAAKTVAQTADSLGLPGDNLNLYAVLDLFKKSSSVEDFESRLNNQDNHVNNLDLNGDNEIDYIRVVDYGKDDFHTLVLQVPVSKTEAQDVAVIEVQKNANNDARIQIVGDEALYGKDYIIAPVTEEQQQRAKTANYSTNTPAVQQSQTNVYVNVWGWPSVTYLYGPGYVYWVSPWYWGYYPGWWRPWRPYGFYRYRQWYYAHPYYYSYCNRFYYNPFYGPHQHYYGQYHKSSPMVQKSIAMKPAATPVDGHKMAPTKAGLVKDQGIQNRQVAQPMKMQPVQPGQQPLAPVKQQNALIQQSAPAQQQPVKQNMPVNPQRYDNTPRQQAPVQQEPSRQNIPVSPRQNNPPQQQQAPSPRQNMPEQPRPQRQQISPAPRMHSDGGMRMERSGGGMRMGGGGGMRMGGGGGGMRHGGGGGRR